MVSEAKNSLAIKVEKRIDNGLNSVRTAPHGQLPCFHYCFELIGET